MEDGNSTPKSSADSIAEKISSSPHKISVDERVKFSNELLYLVLQYLKENSLFETAHRLERESTLIFDKIYFFKLIRDGQLRKAKKYLSSFEDSPDNFLFRKWFYLLMYELYLETLHSGNALEALKILKEDIKPLTDGKKSFKGCCELLTRDDIRSHPRLADWTPEDAREEIIETLEKELDQHPVIANRLQTFSKAPSTGRLRTLVNQSLHYQHSKCNVQTKKYNVDTLFRDHRCLSSHVTIAADSEEHTPVSNDPAIEQCGGIVFPQSPHAVVRGNGKTTLAVKSSAKPRTTGKVPSGASKTLDGRSVATGDNSRKRGHETISPSHVSSPSGSDLLTASERTFEKRLRNTEQEQYQQADWVSSRENYRRTSSGNTSGNTSTSVVVVGVGGGEDLPVIPAGDRMRIELSSPATAIAFCPQVSSWLLIGTMNGTLELYDIETNKLLFEQSMSEILASETVLLQQNIRRIKWDREGTLVGILMDRWLLVFHFAFHMKQNVKEKELASSFSLVEIISSKNGNIDSNESKEEHESLVVPTDFCFSLLSTSISVCVTAGFSDGSLLSWDLSSKSLVKYWKSDHGAILSIFADFKDGVFFACTSAQDGAFQLWTLDSNQCSHLISETKRFTDFTEWNGRLLCCGDVLTEMDMSEGDMHKQFEEYEDGWSEGQPVHLQLIRNRFVACANSGKTVKIWDAHTAKLVRKLDLGTLVIDISVNSEGSFLVVLTSQRPSIQVFISANVLASTLKKSDRNMLIKFSRSIHKGSCSVILYEPSGEIIYSLGGEDCKLVAFQLETSLTAVPIGVHGWEGISNLVPKINEKEKKRTLNAENKTRALFPCLAITHNGNHLFSSSGNNVRLYVASDLSLLRIPTVEEFSYYGKNSLQSILETPTALATCAIDSNRFAIGIKEDCTVRVFSVVLNRELHCLRGHKTIVTSLLFLANMIISGSMDGELRIWNEEGNAFSKQMVSTSLKAGIPVIQLEVPFKPRIQKHGIAEFVLVVQQSQLALFDTESSTIVTTYQPPNYRNASITAACFTADGRYIACALADSGQGTIVVLEVKGSTIFSGILAETVLPKDELAISIAAHPTEIGEFAVGTNSGYVHIIQIEWNGHEKVLSRTDSQNQ